MFRQKTGRQALLGQHVVVQWLCALQRWGEGMSCCPQRYARPGPQPRCNSQQRQLQQRLGRQQQQGKRQRQGKQQRHCGGLRRLAALATPFHPHLSCLRWVVYAPGGAVSRSAGVANWSCRRMPEWAFSPTPPGAASLKPSCLLAQHGPPSQLSCTFARTIALYLHCVRIHAIQPFINLPLATNGGATRPASRSDRADNVR